MSQTLQSIQRLIEQGQVRISIHGYDELVADAISARDAVAGVIGAVEVEDYPEYSKGPAVLVLKHDTDGQPIHILWGIPKGYHSPAVLITAYRPDPRRWSSDFMRRKP